MYVYVKGCIETTNLGIPKTYIVCIHAYRYIRMNVPGYVYMIITRVYIYAYTLSTFEVSESHITTT